MSSTDDVSKITEHDQYRQEPKRRELPAPNSAIMFGLASVGAMSLLILAFFGVMTFYEATIGNTSMHDNNPRPCGNSSTEARANGCVFNQLTWSWIPKSCPSYADQDFKEYRDWKYYADLKGEVEANSDIWEKVYNNEMPLYTVKGEHMTHCVHLLLSMAQVVRDDSPTIPKLREYGHIKHCADHLLMKLSMLPDFDKIGTKTPLVSYEQNCQAKK